MSGLWSGKSGFAVGSGLVALKGGLAAGGGFGPPSVSTNPATYFTNFSSNPVLDSNNFTASGGTNGTIVNSAGNIVAQAAPRFTYDPQSGTLRGLLTENSITNWALNNQMSGAALGTPGTLPTGWSQNLTGGSSVLSSSVVGTGTENGIPYIDIRYFGSYTTSGQILINFTGGADVAANPSETWMMSAYMRIIAGSLNNFSGYGLQVSYLNSSHTFIGNSTSPALFGNTGASSIIKNRVNTTLGAQTVALTAFIKGVIFLSIPTQNASVDITLRLGGIQVEKLGYPTSLIFTGGAQVGRTIDIIAMKGPALAIMQGAAGSVIVNNIRANAVQSFPYCTDNGSGYYNVGNTRSIANGLNSDIQAGTPTLGAYDSFGVAWSAAGRTVTGKGATANHDANPMFKAAVTACNLGSNTGSFGAMDGVITSLAMWNTALPDATLTQICNSGGLP